MRHISIFGLVVLGVILLGAYAPQAPESWPGYEGRLHQSSSSVDIPPSGLQLAWSRRFDILVPVNEARIWGDPGTMHARNLVALNGRLALAATVDAAVSPNLACVTVLDAADGHVVNCLKTSQRLGSYKNMLDATDTAMGEQVLGWDSETGILFLSIGGDQACRTAIDPLANLATYTGHAQNAAGAYASLAANFPQLRSARRIVESDSSDPGRTRADEYNPNTGGHPMPPDQWDIGSMYGSNDPNMCGFFDFQAGSDYLTVCKDLGHSGSGGIMLVNKRTGLAASADWNQSLNTDLGWTAFKMWNGALVNGDRAYYMGPYDPGVPGNDVAAAGVQSGLRLGALQFANQNLHPLDGGYAGPGRDESAVKTARLFDYARVSSGPGSWNEADNTYRNKAMLLDAQGVWAAWKPGQAAPIQIVRATPSVNQAWSLSVGAGMRGQDVWPNMALADLGAQGKFLVYALFNARTAAGSPPNGPATLTVFDANAGVERWTVTLNTAGGTGSYPTLRPHSHELYFELARMVVAGSHAYVAWVDTQTGPNLTLKVVGFDISAPSAPATPPEPLSVDLGVALNSSPAAGVGNLESRVSDLIAVDGTLYALINESPDLLRNGHVHAQQVVALTSSGASPPPPPPAGGTGGGSQGGGGGGGGCGLLGPELLSLGVLLRFFARFSEILSRSGRRSV
ncbi:MAG TPA: hypothetical protein VNM14_23530 [Planctomycetota bacterium]|nr:hypothetical protein [Planctomycetota bacterium]